MGTNLHVHIEVKLNGKWEHFAAPCVTRDYHLFAAINGLDAEFIRPSNRPIAVSRHHELPEDMSAITRVCLEQSRSLGLRGFGYLEAEDIDALQEELYRSTPEVCRTGFDKLNLEHNIFRTCIGGNTIAGHTGFEDSRIVYWYDG